MGNDAKPSLGALYEDSVQYHPAPSLPNISGTSLGSAYEAWYEADQEAQWIAALERRRGLASSDDTQVISREAVEAYARHQSGGTSTLGAQFAAGSTMAAAPESGGADSPEGTATQQITVSRETSNEATEDNAADKAAQGGILRSSAIMAAGTLVSRVLGLLRTSLTFAAIGAGTVANTWDVANTLPNIIYLLLAGGVINAVLVPQITRALDHSDGGKAYTDRILTLALTILFGVTVLFMIAAPWVYRLFDAHDMTPEKSHVALMFTLICLPQIFFYGVYTVFGQVLNARGHFGAFMWSPALANVVIIAGLVAYIVAFPHGEQVPAYGDWTSQMIMTLALPATLGIIAQALVLIPVLRKAGYTYTPSFQFRGVGLRSASSMAGWAFVAVIVQQVGLIITTQLLSSQPDGAPNKAAQSGAFLLFTLPHSLVTLSLVTALFTRMSIAAGRGEVDKVKEDISTGIRLSGIASVMLTFGCFALAFPLVGTIFGAAETRMWSIGSIAIAMLIGLVPYSLCLVFQRVFYAYNDAKTPFWMQIVCTGVAIALTLPWFNWNELTDGVVGWHGLQGSHFLGHPGTHWVGVGVGLAQTLSNVVQAVMGYVLLRKKIGDIPLSDAVRTYVRLSIAAIAATIPSYLVLKIMGSYLEMSRITAMVELLVIGTLFLALYVAVAKALRVREINDLLSPVTRRLKRA